MRGMTMSFIVIGMLVVLSLSSMLASTAATPIGRVAVGTMEYVGQCGEEVIAFEAHDQANGTWRFQFLEEQGSCGGLAVQHRTAPGSPEAGFHGGIESVSSTPWVIDQDGTFTIERITWHLYLLGLENLTGPASGAFVVG